MCGLAGALGDLSQGHKDVFKDLMRVASLRGVHSSGVIGVPQRGDYKWAKEVGEPAWLFDTKRYEQATNGLMSALIGHCRHKTQGEINRANAHPFDYPDEGIIGVHNGTLRDYRHLKGHHYQRVDSDVLYEHLAAHGPQDTFSTITGAWACVWYDANTDRINFIRNNERPLWFCWTKDSKAMFWASELWMLYAVERKFDLHPGADEKNPQKFFSLPVDTLWSFSVKPNDRTEKIVMHTPVKIEPKEVRGQAGNSRGGTTQTTSFNRRSPQAEAHFQAHTQQLQGAQATAWKRNPATGVSERVPLPNPEGKAVVTAPSGGEVADPFSSPVGGNIRQMVARNRALRILDNLDDPLPGEETTDSTADGKTITPISAVPFMHTSLTKEDSKTGGTTSQTSKKNILSLPSKNTVASALLASERRSDCSVPSPKSMDLSSEPPEKKRTSLRQISGIWYIHDDKNKVEFTEHEFESNTGACCMFCHNAIGGLEEVHEFLDKNNFMCTTCVTSPVIPDLTDC